MIRVAHPSRAGSIVFAFTAILWASACATEDDPIEDEPAPPGLPSELIAAMQRDLGQTAAQIEARLRAEATAAQLDPALRDQLGAPFAGAWMSNDGGTLIVGITDATLAEEVRAAGAEPQLVTHSLAELDEVKASLDQLGAVDGSIHSWRVDVASNSVVVQADDPRSAAVARFVASVADGRAVRAVASSERPRPLYDVRGGDEYIINGNTLCSVGFAVDRGFVTAGHCGGAGSPTAGGNWIAQGTFRGSTFPGNDHGWVELDHQWASLPYVGNHSGGQVGVLGSQVAAVGSSVCRSGRTTGWRCGVIQAHDVTINYAAGPVYGATQTSACAEGGDSGGSFISGNQAQGVTSGGSGNCSTGGTTFYQPLNPILSAYGLTLKTTGGSGGAKDIVSNYNGKCIDVPGASFVDGARLQMWDCNGTVAQKWTFVDGTVRAGGKCMDVAWANPASGTAIQLVGCSGNLAQRFNLSASGDLVSVLADKCVDIDAWNASSGARLIIWPCTGGANQKWHTR